MVFWKLSKNNLAYLSINRHSVPYLLPYLLPRPYRVHTSTPQFSVNFSSGSFPFPPKTHSSYYSLCFCKYWHGRQISSSFRSNGPSSACHKARVASHYAQVLVSSDTNGKYNCTFQGLNRNLLKSWIHGCFRSYSSSALSSLSKYEKVGVLDGFRRNAFQKQVPEIIDLLRGDKDDLEFKLDSLNVKLSVASAVVLFRALTCEKVSALRFFRWISCLQPELAINSDVCSLVIDNCGHLDDFVAMLDLLKDLSIFGCSLTKKAFGFLSFMTANKALLMGSTKKIVDALHEVGGSSYGSGVYSLIEMLCVLESYDVAKFVMKKTEKRITYYHVLIREMCRRCDFIGAREMLDEMRDEGCAPSPQTYNYVISSLLKNSRKSEAIEMLEEMLEKGCPPDVLTFEIFIYNSCKQGKIQVASQYLEDMVERGLQPRPLTHAAFIKVLFWMQQYDEVHKYVVGSGDYSSNANYSLLANLYRKSGNGVAAQQILSEMMDKGLRPNFRQYKIILRLLNQSRREDLATNLEEQFLHLDSDRCSGGT